VKVREKIQQGVAPGKAAGKQSQVWKDMADSLAKISHDKCWYCESTNPRDDFYVDHYRPKGSVEESPTHSGYWWLAFDPKNLRLSCKYCNELRVDQRGQTRGGKSNHFPIVSEAARAIDPDSDCSTEEPVLLDPTKMEDPPLLTFLEDGTVEPAVPSGFEHDRARLSVKIYHLYHERLTRARSQVATEVREAILRADVSFRRLAAAQRNGATAPEIASLKNDLNEDVARLDLYLDRSYSPYIATARAICQVHLTEQRPFLKSLLDYPR
jgi:uncharacterized protein (TIGR02646 family)